MEDHLTLPAGQEPAPALCSGCGIHPPLEGYPNPLCAGCRHRHIRYPVPRWIWLFAGGIAILMVAGLWRMPQYLGTAVHLARAERAITAHRYLTAQRELEPVIRRFPQDVTANCRLLIAAAHNLDMSRAAAAYAAVSGRTVEDNTLLEGVQEAMSFVQQSIPQDTQLAGRVAALKSDPDALEALYALADSAGQDGPMAGFLVADHLYDLKLYSRCAAVLGKVLATAPENYPAQCLMISVKRELHDYAGAMTICDHLLEGNREDVKIIASKSRLELKRHRDAAARQYAREAMALDDHDLLAMEATALVRYYEGRTPESRQLLAQIQAEELPTGDSTVSNRLAGILNGTTIFR